MSPEERQLLTGLFDRIRGAAATPRDPEAEALISDNVRSMPYAPYLLAQAVIVQDQALQAANTKIQELEAHLQEVGQQQQAPGQGGFLSGLGSIFGGGQQRQAPPPPPPQGSPWGQQGQQQYAQPQGGPGGPWGGGPEGPMGGPQPGGPGGGFLGGGQPGGGGFLKGALGAAAGVAGGVLLADSIRGLFGQHNNPLGMATGFSPGLGGLGGGSGNTGGETVINNYYDNDSTNRSPDSVDYGSSSDPSQDDSYDVSDDGDFGSDNNDSYDV
jgi:hypothetical protein